MMVRRTTALSVLMVAALAGTLLTGSPAQATPPVTKAPVAVGRGGAVVHGGRRRHPRRPRGAPQGGNAVDAAVAAAATLGVTEPFSAGIGGGGFLVFYDARTGTVSTIDGREAAPASMGETAFVNPATGLPFQFQEARVCGISVGVPGTPPPGTVRAAPVGHDRPCADALRPAIEVAGRGFTVDQTFRTRSTTTPPPSRSSAPPARSTCPAERRPRSARRSATPTWPAPTACSPAGRRRVLPGPAGRDIVRTVQHPPVVAAPPVPWPFPIRPGDAEARRPGRLRGADPTADPRPLPRPRRLRHADPVQRRLDRRRGAQHH